MNQWLCPFVFGMYISYYNSFDSISVRMNTNYKAVYCSALAIMITAYLRATVFSEKTTIDFLFAFAIIIFSFLILSKISIINTALEQLGKHSGAIFMFHTFIYSYYFKNSIYFFKYAPLIFLVMVLVCYSVALALEWLKKLTRYDKLIKRILR